jgi:hypothetical protein
MYIAIGYALFKCFCSAIFFHDINTGNWAIKVLEILHDQNIIYFIKNINFFSLKLRPEGRSFARYSDKI